MPLPRRARGCGPLVIPFVRSRPGFHRAPEHNSSANSGWLAPAESSGIALRYSVRFLLLYLLRSPQPDGCDERAGCTAGSIGEARVLDQNCRSIINCLIAPIAFAGFNPFGHVSVQFMIV